MIFPLPVVSVGDCIAIVFKGETSFTQYRILPTKITEELFGNKLRWKAHRLAFCLNNYEIPVKPPNLKEGFVLHSCHNKWCVNPAHLKIGTVKQNSIEAHEQNPDWRVRQANAIRGIKHTPEHNAKIARAGVGRRHSAETKAKMSNSAKNKWSARA